MYEIPHELKEERDRLVTMIYEAFDGVTREGGLSWRQAELEDELSFTTEQFEDAGKKDSEARWHDLVRSHIFDFPLCAWSFLDPIGFRYYLAPCMLTCLQTGQDESGIQFHLSIAYISDSSVEHRLKQWSMLNERQCKCVARFVQIMGAWDRAYHATNHPNDWEYALEAHWDKFIPPGTSSIPKFVDQRIFFTLDDQ